ncbi:hypothetical protein BJF90_01945 [Pseudonocardia sp. CNS-004]|nr:hypothetical protein BJF90_01945 [Pseudonocardia sp. CNS-004]
MPLDVAWSDGLLGVVCLLVGLSHIGMPPPGPVRFAHAAAHAVMGIGMAAMFVPAADPVPRPVWVAVFLAVAVWFASACVRARSLLGDAGNHVVGAVAMLYMLLGPAHHHGGPGSAVPALPLSLVALAFAAWFGIDLVGRVVRPAADADVRPAVPRMVMSAAMAVMFLGRL